MFGERPWCSAASKRRVARSIASGGSWETDDGIACDDPDWDCGWDEELPVMDCSGWTAGAGAKGMVFVLVLAAALGGGC